MVQIVYLITSAHPLFPGEVENELYRTRSLVQAERYYQRAIREANLAHPDFRPYITLWDATYWQVLDTTFPPRVSGSLRGGGSL